MGGRKRVLQRAYMLIGVAGLGSLFANHFVWIVTCRAIVGVGIMMGSGPSLAIVSETVPARMRMPLQVVRSAAHCFGGMVVAAAAVCDDVGLVHLHWGPCSVMLAAFSFVMYAGVLLIPDSPVFMANVGKTWEAKRALKWMSKVNGCADVDVNFFEQCEIKTVATVPLVSRLAVIFSKTYRLFICTAAVACFSMNLVLSGALYAQEELLEGNAGKRQGWSLLLESTVGLILCVIAGPLVIRCSRSFVMSVSLLGGAVGCVVWCVCRSMPTSPMTVLGLQISGSVGYLQTALGFVVVYQYAVDMFPANVGCTSSALVNFAGRLACVLGPPTFDLLLRRGMWQLFYGIMIGFCLLSWGCVKSSNEEKTVEHPKMTYGSIKV